MKRAAAIAATTAAFLGPPAAEVDAPGVPPMSRPGATTSPSAAGAVHDDVRSPPHHKHRPARGPGPRARRLPGPAASRASRRPAGRPADVTAYCWTGSPTASGVWPRRGMAATLDRSVPFGTTVVVDGLGEFVVTDRIGWGSDVDIYLGGGATCERRAAEFGRQRRIVTYEQGSNP